MFARLPLLLQGTLTHSYPFCWRSETPLIYKAVPSFFVRVEPMKEKLMANNMKTYWVPSFVQEKRFHNWLKDARDWAISRSRFWGTPLPIWQSEDGEETVVIGSIDELAARSGVRPTDLHRHFVDQITIPSARAGKPPLRRVDDVFDCWFESGSMPYAQQHYPFENVKLFEDNFPADFIAEGLDQTRGWFYTLLVLSTALFDRPPFRNLICNGLVLAADGKKMSKRLRNYPPPEVIVNEYGADALRLYLINSPVVRAEPLRFKKEGVFAVVKDVLLPWYNAYRFLAQSTPQDFAPHATDLARASNVLDRWILAATDALVGYVREEMAAYRLYTVVPALVAYIEQLTNVYVRLNRRRLKGRTDPADCAMAQATLFASLLTLCKAMAPFTPFFTEVLYQNLRRALPAGEALESVHFCSFPEPRRPPGSDKRIQVRLVPSRITLLPWRLMRWLPNSVDRQHSLQQFSVEVSPLLLFYPGFGRADAESDRAGPQHPRAAQPAAQDSSARDGGCAPRRWLPGRHHRRAGGVREGRGECARAVGLR